MMFAQRKLPDFSAIHTEVLGAEAAYAEQSRARVVREVVLRLVVDHTDAKALDLFARELGSVGLSFAQGTAGLIGGRPKATPVIRLYSFFIPKTRITQVTVQIGNEQPFVVEIPHGNEDPFPTALHEVSLPCGSNAADEPMVDVPLIRVAHARSGDKGNSSNIAIFCRKPEYVMHLRTVLTAERIAAHFSSIVAGPVVRYEAPGLSAFNFVLDNALGGGGMASARMDSQGKAYGQRSLEMMVPIPQAWGLA